MLVVILAVIYFRHIVVVESVDLLTVFEKAVCWLTTWISLDGKSMLHTFPVISCVLLASGMLVDSISMLSFFFVSLDRNDRSVSVLNETQT